jgi:hypothetical protein
MKVQNVAGGCLSKHVRAVLAAIIGKVTHSGRARGEDLVGAFKKSASEATNEATRDIEGWLESNHIGVFRFLVLNE